MTQNFLKHHLRYTCILGGNFETMATRTSFLNKISRGLDQARHSNTDHSSDSPAGASSGGINNSGQTPSRRQLPTSTRSPSVTLTERSCDALEFCQFYKLNLCLQRSYCWRIQVHKVIIAMITMTVNSHGRMVEKTDTLQAALARSGNANDR